MTESPIRLPYFAVTAALLLAVASGCTGKESPPPPPAGDADGDGVSDDADCAPDDPTVSAPTTWYSDGDGDGFGSADEPQEACSQPAGAVDNADDCDDGDPDSSPEAVERCDEVDNDCDGDIDEDAEGAPTWYADADGDGFGDALRDSRACEQPDGATLDGADCDDSDDAVNPGADELCDDRDNDCDGDIDEEDAVDAPTWYLDRDGDRHGDPDSGVVSCTAPEGTVALGDDCDDRDAGASPDSLELCDGEDNNCDGTVDEADAIDASTWYFDDDADGHGDPTSSAPGCTAPAGTVDSYDDCDDSDSTAYPGAPEACDLVDSDCDGADMADAVAPTGSAWPAVYTVIQDAIDAASAGDTVCVEPGTYSEVLDLSGKDLELIGAGGASATIVDGGGAGSVLSIQGGATAATLLSGFTLRNGEATFGGGLLVSDSSPRLDDLVVEENTAAVGGGVALLDAEVSLDTVEISDNIALRPANAFGGGLYIAGGVVSLSQVTITDNLAYSYAYSGVGDQSAGGGLYAREAVLDLRDVTLSDNGFLDATTGEGAGAFVGASVLQAEGLTLSGNEANDAGGLALLGGGPHSLSDLRVSDNSVEGSCGGLMLAASTAVVISLTDAEISDNLALERGGGLCAGGTVTLSRVTLQGNLAETGGGLSLSGDVSASNLLFLGNQADLEGGAISVASGGALTLRNSTLAGNLASTGALYSGEGAASVALDNVSFYANQCGADSGALAVYDASVVSVAYSHAFANSPADYAGMSDPTGTDGNITGDPLFADVSSADPTAWDTRLGLGSPLIDAGDPGVLDADGSVSDIGATGGPLGL